MRQHRCTRYSDDNVWDWPTNARAGVQELHHPEFDGVAVTSVDEQRDRCAEVRLGGIVKREDQRVALERLLDGGSLHALAAPMNQAHFAQAGLVRGVDVLLDD